MTSNPKAETNREFALRMRQKRGEPAPEVWRNTYTIKMHVDITPYLRMPAPIGINTV